MHKKWRNTSGWCAARQAHSEHRTRALCACHRHIATHHARELARDGEAATDFCAETRAQPPILAADLYLPADYFRRGGI
jgi:hypothetical protein